VPDELRATARAGANIAFLKYWGWRDERLQLPLNDSISMTLSETITMTTVAYDPDLRTDEVYIDGERVLDHRATRVSRHLDRIRRHYYDLHARVVSLNSFPQGTGMGSSASGFAALTAAAIGAFGEGMPEDRELSIRARRASGSACRSVFGGIVRWQAGESDSSSHAETLFEPHWWDLRDVCLVVSAEPKEVPNAQGHRLAAAHPFMPVRQRSLPGRAAAMTAAIAQRDLAAFGALLEQESLEVQAVMLSSTPPCLYLSADTVEVLRAVPRWREDRIGVYVTLDAGPNPHLICEARDERAVVERAEALLDNATIVCSRPGPGVTMLDDHLI